MTKVLFFILLILAVWIFFIKDNSVKHAPGVLVPDLPLQENIPSAKSFSFKGFTITPLAHFEIKARVLSREDYSRGKEGELSPVDLALGWKRMSDSAILSELSISQSGRWYRWETEVLPIPRREIERHSANMHMIPKDKAVQEVLERVRKGDVVYIRGKLVRVNAKEGWHWSSSLSRDDTGRGACEIIYVEEVDIQELYP